MTSNWPSIIHETAIDISKPSFRDRDEQGNGGEKSIRGGGTAGVTKRTTAAAIYHVRAVERWLLRATTSPCVQPYKHV